MFAVNPPPNGALEESPVARAPVTLDYEYIHRGAFSITVLRL